MTTTRRRKRSGRRYTSDVPHPVVVRVCEHCGHEEEGPADEASRALAAHLLADHWEPRRA